MQARGACHTNTHRPPTKTTYPPPPQKKTQNKPTKTQKTIPKLSYYEDGADEVAFLNITGFRDCPLADLPMLDLLSAASERVFVPVTVGGGIRGFDAGGESYSALEVAAAYFKSGADKVSIGGDAVDAALEYYARGGAAAGNTAIEQISAVYGAQAVVVSIDPRRVWVADPSTTPHRTVRVTGSARGPAGEEHCWWQCTVKGGREGRDLGAVELAVAVEALGAGEIMLNCIDNDGQGIVCFVVWSLCVVVVLVCCVPPTSKLWTPQQQQTNQNKN